MFYSDIKYPDIANGEGVRVSLFVSGCTHHCKGCFNPETWNFKYGKEFTQYEIDFILKYLEHSWVDGLSLLGGEPFEYENQQGLLPLLREVKARFPEKTIWCYSGYLLEEDILNDMCLKWKETREMINYIDVLVDGEFKLDLKDISLKFRGSSNQRIIDVKKSLQENEIVMYKFKE